MDQFFSPAEIPPSISFPLRTKRNPFFREEKKIILAPPRVLTNKSIGTQFRSRKMPTNFPPKYTTFPLNHFSFVHVTLRPIYEKATSLSEGFCLFSDHRSRPSGGKKETANNDLRPTFGRENGGSLLDDAASHDPAVDGEEERALFPAPGVRREEERAADVALLDGDAGDPGSEVLPHDGRLREDLGLRTESSG